MCYYDRKGDDEMRRILIGLLVTATFFSVSLIAYTATINKEYVSTKYGEQERDPADEEGGVISNLPETELPNGLLNSSISLFIIEEDLPKFEKILKEGKTPRFQEVPAQKGYRNLKIFGTE